MESQHFKKQFPKNLMMNGLSFLVNVFAGLWLIPYLVKTIGIAAYGLVPLAMTFTSYIGLITASISSAVTRFITIDIQSNNWKEANRTFNTAFFALLGLVCIQIPILGFITYNVEDLINVPPNLILDTFYLFLYTFLGYLLSLFSSIFNSSMYAYNRIDLTRMIDISNVVVRISVIIALFSIYEPSLRYIGISNFLAGLLTCILSLINWKKLTPHLNVKFSSYDKKKLRQITSMGGWLTVNMVGYLLFLKIDLFIVNKYIGNVAGGEYAAILQWNSLIRTVAGVLSGVVGPMILISFASKKIKNVINYARLGVKFLSLSIGILTGLISGFSYAVLTLWIGEDFSKFAPLLIIMLCHLGVNLGILPLLSINTALNKVKIPGIVSILMGGLNLILALIFVVYLNWGFYGVAIAGGISLTLKNGIFTPWYAAKILNINKLTFFKPVVSGITMFIICLSIGYFFSYTFNIDSWLKLIFYMITAGLIIIPPVWVFIIDKADKKLIISFLPLRISNLFS